MVETFYKGELLKKCPFCGGEAEIRVSHDVIEDFNNMYIECTVCRTQTSELDCSAKVSGGVIVYQPDYDPVEVIMEKWNRRVLEAVTTAEAEIRNNAIEEFKKMLLKNKVVDKSVVRRVAEQLKTANTSNGWIPVEERLPETSGSYIADNGIWVGESKFNAETKKWDASKVIAWMPLPIAYKKEKLILNKLQKFIDIHEIECVETVYQKDEVNLEYVDLVADLVEIILGE